MLKRLKGLLLNHRSNSFRHISALRRYRLLFQSVTQLVRPSVRQSTARNVMYLTFHWPFNSNSTSLCAFVWCSQLKFIYLFIWRWLRAFVLAYQTTLLWKHFKGRQNGENKSIHNSDAHFAPPTPPHPTPTPALCGPLELLHRSASEAALKCTDNWGISQVTGAEEEALSVLSQPTSCCDNVSDLAGDNTLQPPGERGDKRG